MPCVLPALMADPILFTAAELPKLVLLLQAISTNCHGSILAKSEIGIQALTLHSSTALLIFYIKIYKLMVHASDKFFTNHIKHQLHRSNMQLMSIFHSISILPQLRLHLEFTITCTNAIIWQEKQLEVLHSTQKYSMK